jgi:hypothetical protein
MTQDSRPTNRRLMTLPQGSKIPVAYGCTECYWRYDRPLPTRLLGKPKDRQRRVYETIQIKPRNALLSSASQT